MKQIAFTNEKGNVSVKVRNAVREQAKAQFIPADFKMAEDGSFVKQVAVDAATGEAVLVVLTLAVTNVMPSKKERKGSAKAETKTTVDVPNLFADEVEETETEDEINDADVAMAASTDTDNLH